MNTKICILPFFVFLPLFVDDLQGQKLSIGTSIGPTFFTQKAEKEEIVHGVPLYKSRFNAQCDLRIQFTDNFALKQGFFYEQKGYLRKHTATWGYAIDQHKFDYLSIPLLIELSIGQRFKLKAHGGISAELLLKQRFIRQITIDKHWFINDTDEYDRVNYSSLAGIGMEFPLSKKISLELGGRNSIGLKTLQKENSTVRFRFFGFVTFLGFRVHLADTK